MADDERTRVFGADRRGDEHIPAPGDAHATNRLPVGTRFGEFEIVGMVGEGGFGIVYLAHDHALDYRLAIKEYMPSALAYRAANGRVAVKSERMRDTFEAGLRSFVTEAKLLAHFDHPALVKAFRLWEANGTAYMAMRFYEGITLKDALGRLDGAPSEAWLKRLLAPLLDAVDTMHAERVYHRDIAPDNILILPDGRPVLLDFGAARRVIGEVTQALTVILKPGFAPIEQYAEIPDLAQGAWTDVYALAAVVHYSIGGRTPPPSVSRMVRDSMVPARELGAGRYDAAFLDAIDRALSVRPEQRPVSIVQFRAALGLRPVPSTTPPLDDGIVDPLAALGGRSSGESSPSAEPAGDPGARRATSSPSPSPSASPAPTPSSGSSARAADDGASSRGSSRWLAGAALAVVAVALAGGAGLLLYRTTAPTPPPKPAPISDVGDVPRPVEPRIDDRPSSDAGGPQQPPPVVVAPRAPFSPLAAIDTLARGAAADRTVAVDAPQRTVRIGGQIRFSVRSERDGYLYVLLAGTDGTHLYQVFPNGYDADNRIAAGTALTLPRKPRDRTAWSLEAGGPPGTNHFVAIVTDQPRDFGDAGLQKSDDFPAFDLDVLRRRWDDAPDPLAAISGRPACAPGASCDTAYGAARFTVEEVKR